MSSQIDVLFLRDERHGGPPDQAHTVAARLIDFVGAATHTLDVAIYDFRLSDELARPVVEAFVAAADRGLQVRIAYDAGKPAAADQAAFARLQADPAPTGTAQWVTSHFAGTDVQVKAITAPGDQLMHSKYVIRDAGRRHAAVWTGSANWTDDAWTRQENNLLTVVSRRLAAGYQVDFDQLWTAGTIGGSGAAGGGTTSVRGIRTDWYFAPADGHRIDDVMVQRVSDARRRIVLAAMVITSHPLLAALAAAIERGTPVAGVYDAGQMGPIAARWAKNPHDADVVTHWKLVRDRLVGKPSIPYTPTSVHNFMHNKLLVTDLQVATGSYNFSANAQHNAENQLRFANGPLAHRFTAYAEAVADAYR